MPSDTFELAESGGYRYWLQHDGDMLALYRGSSDAPTQELGRLTRDRVRDFVLWAGGEDRVSTVFEGPMANEIKKASAELGIPEQMIVWNAVKLFLDVGGEH